MHDSSDDTQSYRVPRADLPPLYYLHNFQALICRVYTLYDDLLNSDELLFYKHFQQLSLDAQALYVRLLGRRGQYFRMQKIHYSEIEHSQRAVKELISANFLAYPEKLSLEWVYPLYTKAEWLQVLDDLACKQLKREALKKHIEACENLEVLLSDRVNQDRKPVVKVSLEECFTTYKLLYFCNSRQDLTDFILRDLGIHQYENYPLEKENRFFQSRRQIDAMLDYAHFQEQSEALMLWSKEQLLDFDRQLPEGISASPMLTADCVLLRRIQRLRLQVARQLERLDADQDALALYQRCSSPPSRERQARLLKKMGRLAEAGALCEEMLETGSEAEQVFSRQFMRRLCRERKQAFLPEYFQPTHEERELVPEAGCSVEVLVARSLASQGHCFFVENHLILGVFGLVFWPVIFANVRGAFSHAFQSRPHDLYETDFVVQRQILIDEGFQRLAFWQENPGSISMFAKTKRGIVNPFVNWGLISDELLELSLERIPLAHWHRIFERLWRDLKENRSGLPDLVFFPAYEGYELIEVKGPGDRLQKNQLRWLAYFHQQGISYRVLYIQWMQPENA